MRTLRFTTIAIAVAALNACQQTAKPISPADEAAIRAADSAIVAAINAGDAAAATAGYAANATVLPPNMPPARGADGIRQLYSGLSGLMNVNFAIKSERIGGEGNVGYHIGSYHFTGTLKDSTHAPVPPEDGKYLQVYTRQGDGSWKVVAEAWSANAAPPPAPRAPSRRH